MKKVLLVEASSVPPILNRSLDYLNYEVISIPHNDTTLDCVEMHNPNLVLIPFNTQGGKKGLDIVREIRSTSAVEKTPVIVVSNSDRAETLVDQIKQTKQYNVSEFIIDPDRNIGLLIDRITLHVSSRVESAWETLPPLPRAILTETLSAINALFDTVEKCALTVAEISQMKQSKNFISDNFVQLSDGRAISIGKLWNAFSAKRLEEITKNIGLQIVDRENRVDILLQAMYDHDNYNFTHSVRVAVYLGLLLKYERAGYQDFSIHLPQMIMAALLHDIGHTMVDKNLLHKSGEITKDEMAILRGHSGATEKIISSQKGFSKLTAQTAATAHERLDGSGYPYGFDESKLYPSARMIAIVDAYDAMNSKVPYRKTLTPSQAFAELRADSNKFDQRIVDKFEELLHKLGRLG